MNPDSHFQPPGATSKFYVPLEKAEADEEVIQDGYAVFSIKSKPQSLPLSRNDSHHSSLSDSSSSSGVTRFRRVQILKAGSLEAIVDCLAPSAESEIEVESLLMNMLLCTYPAFTSTEQLMETIFKKLSASQEMKQTSALLVTLNSWLSPQYQMHFYQPPQFAALHQLQLLCEECLQQKQQQQQQNCDVSNEMKQPRQGSAASDFDFETFRKKLQSLRLQAQRRLHNFENEWKSAAAAASRSSTHLHKRIGWNEMENLHVAEQLTRMDAELFIKVQLHECLGSSWSQHKRRNCSATVQATVAQFNLVCNAVNWQLLQPNRNQRQRLRCLSRWILIAQLLRERKNFSSLFAIIYTLNSQSIKRLSCLWRRLPAHLMQLHTEFSRLCDSVDNFSGTRQAIDAEATAATSACVEFDLSGSAKRNSRIVRQFSFGSAAANYSANARFYTLPRKEQSSGIVPYLGTSLTDLEGIHNAFPDKVHSHLINIDKRHREYEILARLRLYQITCRQYFYPNDARFTHWLRSSVPQLNQEQVRLLSCNIQPDLPRDISCYELSSCASDDNASLVDDAKAMYLVLFKLQIPVDLLQQQQQQQLHHRTNSIAGDSDLTFGVYKSVMVQPSDKTRAVVETVLGKYRVSANPEYFVIVQVMSDGSEVTLTEGSNIYYALNPRETTDSIDAKQQLQQQQQQQLQNGSCPPRLLCLLRHRDFQPAASRRARSNHIFNGIFAWFLGNK